MEEEEEEDLPDWKDNTLVQPIVRSQLTSQEKEDVYGIFKEFSDILQSCPGLTNLTEHCIGTGSLEKTIRVPPYRIKHAYREAVMKELDEMERHGVIEAYLIVNGLPPFKKMEVFDFVSITDD